MSNYLVTGGAGFIGSHIVERLLELGHRVRVLDNLSTGNRGNVPPGAEFLEGDLQNPDVVREAVQGIEVVFHEAALASVPLSMEAPLKTHHACVTGTVVLLDEARKAGVRRIVYAASSSAYGNNPEMPKVESQVPEVISPYGAAKLAAELYLEAFAASFPIETVRLRYFNVFGPRQDPSSPYSAVIPLFVDALLKGKNPTIFGDGLQSRDFTYVSNVVNANLLAADAPGISGKVYNTACGESINLLELLQEICQLLRVPYAPIFAPPRAGDVKHSWSDISRVQKDLGYRVEIGWKEGLARTIEYYVNAQKGKNR